MSLEQYRLLSEQERVAMPTTFPQSLIFRLKTVFQVLFFNKHTELEQLLIKDNKTFTTSLTATHASVDRLENYGDIYNITIPHPLKKELSNNTYPESVFTEIDQLVNEAPVLVFIHGLGGNLQQFDEQLEKFQGISDIIAFDLPGSGYSTYDLKNFKLTLDGFSEFVIEFLKFKNLFEKDLIIVAHSYGTQIALRLVDLLGDKIKGVALLAPPKTPFTRPWIQTISLKIFRHIPFLFDIFRKFDRLNNIESHSLKRLFADKDIDDYIKFKQFKFNLSTVSHNFLTHALEWDPLTERNVLDASEYIKNRLLIVDGAEDRVTGNGGEYLKNFIGASADYTVIPHAGHNFTLDSYETVNELLAKFFKKIDPTLDEAYINDLKNKLIRN